MYTSKVMKCLFSVAPMEAIENIDDVDTVGDAVSVEYNDLLWRWPPATRRAFEHLLLKIGKTLAGLSFVEVPRLFHSK